MRSSLHDILIVPILMLAFCPCSVAVTRGAGLLQVVEIVDHEEDPWAAMKVYYTEFQIAEERQLIKNLRRVRPPDSEAMKSHRTRIVELRKELRALRNEAKHGMCEIRGWDSAEGKEIILECRGQGRKEARRLSVGTYVSFLEERRKQDILHRPGWLQAVDLKIVRDPPAGWKSPSADQVYSWSREDITATAQLRCDIRSVTTSSGRSISVRHAWCHSSNTDVTSCGK